MSARHSIRFHIHQKIAILCVARDGIRQPQRKHKHWHVRRAVRKENISAGPRDVNKKSEPKQRMNVTRTDFVFMGLAVGLGLLCYALGGAVAVRDALFEARALLLTILPQLAGGLLIGGLVKQLVGKEWISAHLGTGSGLRGLMIATAAGALTPGGPFMSFPIVYAFRTAGAEISVLVAYITAWSLLGFVKMTVWELPLMGLDFTLVRVLVCLPLPLLAGLLARHASQLRVFQTEPGQDR